MRYLITGGAGFIGSHLAERLIADGHSVHALDDLSTGTLENVRHLENNDQFTLTVGDILDLDLLKRCAADCDQIFHLAAKVGVKIIMEQPVETIITNVKGTENVLEVAHAGNKKVLIASTSEVYGKSMETNASIQKLSETDDWTLGTTEKRRWAYACTKAVDEFLALAYHAEYNLPVVIARYFNTVGPRQTGRYGMVVPNFVRQALAGEPIRVFGDGEQTRCFTHVKDVVWATIELMNTPAAEGQLFNIGSGEEISMNALAERVRTLAESTSPIEHVSYDEAYGPGYEDMRRRTPDISKLKDATGYEPQNTTDDVIHDVISYYKVNAAAPQPTGPIHNSPVKVS
jgi:UDP-glucose 4-epimerase